MVPAAFALTDRILPALVFLTLVVAGFGAVTWLWADALLTRSPLSRAVLGGLAVFWCARLYCQFFVYRPELWRGDAVNTIAHVLFTALWTYLAGVYVAAFWRQF